MERMGGTFTKDELETEAQELAMALSPDEAHARVVALSGDLGAGKTTFTQALARALGVDAHVTSPTFVIEKRYALAGQRFENLIHVDAYRLEDETDLEKLDWASTVGDPKNLIVIEWAERVRGLLPEDTVFISFAFLEEHTREISYEKEQ